MSNTPIGLLAEQSSGNTFSDTIDSDVFVCWECSKKIVDPIINVCRSHKHNYYPVISCRECLDKLDTTCCWCKTSGFQK